MTSQSPRIYTYKITFEEVPYYYYGVHKERKYNEYYMGSPYTHKWMWKHYTPKKQILEFFEYTDDGWIEAQEVEKRLIKPFYNDDKWCLNENVGGRFSIEHQRRAGRKSGVVNGKKAGQKCKELGLGICGLSYEERVKYGKIGLEKQKELGVGIYALTPEQMTENGKKAAEVNRKNGTGLFGLSKEQRSETGKLAGKLLYEMRVGVHGRTKEQMTEDGKKGAQKAKELGLGVCYMSDEERKKVLQKSNQTNKENGTGIYSITPEQRSETAKKVSSQKWMCTETGYITTPGPLTLYQKARGIDTTKRKRIS
jgi:hypothetical protein